MRALFGSVTSRAKGLWALLIIQSDLYYHDRSADQQGLVTLDDLPIKVKGPKLPQGDISTQLSTANLYHTQIGLTSMIKNIYDDGFFCQGGTYSSKTRS